MNIMVVEDERIDMKLACAVLESAGHKILHAETAESALEIVKEHKPDVVLLDLVLPGKDGPALVRQMKQDPSTRDIPVVAITAHPERWPMQDALAAGCDAYIVKPVDTRMLPSQVLDAARPQPRPEQSNGDGEVR